MRLWSIDPSYLDARGLVALWREGLLAQRALMGMTRGYVNHPQLLRFSATRDPVLYIGSYLYYVYLEGVRRGYRFDLGRVVKYSTSVKRVPVTSGQLAYEFRHLLAKLTARDPERYRALVNVREVRPHPLFYVIEGDVEPWERVKERREG
ncbi:rplW 50S ribosomal protein L23 [Acidilobus saccharovorans 345-15]|uniref:RplW 50S ribosomal protein L23 n=1 Tax=Acidilobus saccharovorans (strain DSM 16705 / JCM 18335 / VKM B-2471 / 345-15) TaxID=666510 RepID=D9Q1E0_ACIS3|nr:pyrimidine dimer DNA glycosylase/endonuclease V [Acidilobus saccharovorans]ADL19128.1 rplW 50S ribosomal protein L23 [Acidilobus saccharovorans 345-15]